MLVLVLILVVIALLLLLAGWFLHLVVLAWTSVAISVLAGVVLLYDWWQTRSAERAGRQSVAARDGSGDRSVPGGPVAAGAVGAGVAGAGFATGGPAGPGGPDGFGGADMEPATQVLPIVPPPANAAEQTVVMPSVAPSGSSEAPSGASRSGEISSPAATGVPGDGGRPDEGGTTAVDPAARAEPGAGGDPVTEVASASSTPSSPPGHQQPPLQRDAGSEPAGAARAPVEAAAGATQATQFTSSGPAGPVDDGTTRATVDDPTSVAAAQQPAAADERTRAAEPLDTSGEAPEEPREPTHAALVARLGDEVVVIDEHPRYHVQSCPSLPGRPVIPLPVSEAVELGFTPCGWCAPNRTLAERHPAEVR